MVVYWSNYWFGTLSWTEFYKRTQNFSIYRFTFSTNIFSSLLIVLGESQLYNVVMAAHTNSMVVMNKKHKRQIIAH